MAQLFFQPVWQAVDANGAPLSGALLYFFETTSSTPLTVYQDSGLGTPHAIPVVADTAGMFAPIYVNVAQYKVVLKTSAGVTVQTVDPVSVNGGNTTLESTDSGATAGPILTLLRSSDTPVTNDIIGEVLFQGKDSAANTQDYAVIDARIDDATSTSEDATLRLRAVTAGTMTTGLSLTGSSATFAGTANFGGAIKPSSNDGAALGISGTAWSDAFFASGAVINFGAGDVTITHSAENISFAGGTYNFDNSIAGTSMSLTGEINVETNSWLGGTTRLVQNSTNQPGSGNNTPGAAITSTGQAFFSANSSNHCFNRTDDGTLISLLSGGTAQGSIAISGATTSYNAFFGSHWSQLADGSKPDILRGTICESIDEMCAWPGEAPEERLPRFKISDTPSSKAVYGVFAWWDDEWEATNDAHVGALGAFVIRIDAGQTVQRGDYIESAGNGCGRVQVDDLMRSSTVAKITAAQIVETYPDGSYLVPCTLHCG